MKPKENSSLKLRIWVISNSDSITMIMLLKHLEFLTNIEGALKGKNNIAKILI
jgi:hypothetical protein